MEGEIIDISPQMLAFQVVNILILYFLLRRFLYEPLTNLMQNRTREIEEGLEQAEQNRQRAEQLQKEYDEELQKARREAREIVEKASRQRDELIKEGKDEARKQNEKMISEAREEIRVEQEKAFEELRKDIVRFSVDIAERIIEKEINSESHEKLVDRYLKEVGRIQ